ncbi:hypothetical protein [Methylocella sp. CPCC 101449]|uniref:hypothetical protein n=1 Tax=Methylocella sp. CPCC 101449 TaxID=2987531 RepID=UPI0028907EE2|nr:hypothetical protein [Methylocella sp. CPCC 101449]MDT2024210.1 hypothetical protein [Methylocella sp. CPCC 101449]
MLFLARSVFWLGLVFSWIPWSGGDGAVTGPREAAATLVRQAAESVPGEISRFCQSSPRSCRDVAAKAGKVLTIESLIEADAAQLLAEQTGPRLQ